jgi:hypothetical protein
LTALQELPTPLVAVVNDHQLLFAHPRLVVAGQLLGPDAATPASPTACGRNGTP